MAETAPRVSFYLSAFNAARWLRRAIDSMLTQTFRDIEVILVDDGSDDDTPAIMQAAAETDKRIRVAIRPHEGTSAACNYGVAMARGEYIARLDADDIALPDRVARQVAWLDQHPEVAVLGGAMVIIDSNERKLRVARYVTEPAELQKAVLHYSPIAHSTAMIRRSVFLDVGGYRAAFDLAEDYDLWLRLSEVAQLANMAEVLVYYRSHPGQVSARFSRRLAGLAGLALAAAARRRRGEPDPIPEGFVATAESIRTLGLDAHMQSQIAERLGPGKNP